MFFREGYAGASIDRITALAGVSKATVYSHFGSKEDLLLAVVEEVVEPLKAEYAVALDPAARIDDWLVQLGRMLVRKALLPEVIAIERLIIAEALRFPELGRSYRSVAIDSSLALFVPRLEEAVARGELCRCDPQRAIRHFANLCAGNFHQNALFNDDAGPDPVAVERHIRDTVDLFLHGISPASQQAGA